MLTSSYSNYYRRMLPKLLAAIEFKCNNTAYRPVMDALELLQRYADIPNTTEHYDVSENVPVKGVVPDGWLEVTPREVIRKRLLLVLYALGTNVGIKRVADGGRHGETEAAPRATRHLFVNRDNLRTAIATLVNATLKMRDPAWWGNGTASASDSNTPSFDHATPPRSPR